RAFVLENRLPGLRRIEPLRAEQPCERRVLDRERARKRLVRVDVRRDRLDASARAAADDADARRRGDRELAAEALVCAALGRIGTRPALEREPARRLVRLLAQMPEDAQ